MAVGSTIITLDDILPAPHFHERHERHVAAPPDAVWDALHELRTGELAITRALMGVRILPARLAGRPSRTASARLLDGGPVHVLASDRGRAVVGGAVMQPWRLRGGDRAPSLDAAGLRAFDRAGWVKTGVDFVLHPEAGGTRVTTETRITATDDRTRAKFALYWLVVRPGSGLIRRDLLRGVARRAEGR
jgi:hypothetical protein